MIAPICQANDQVQRDSEAAAKILRLSVCHMLKAPPLEDLIYIMTREQIK